MASVQTTEGDYTWHLPALGRSVNTHYVLHQPNSPTKHTPLVVVHGGPGTYSVYLSTLATLAALHGIPVIFYDQVGCGLSTHLQEKMGDEAFWTMQLFLDELDGLIEHLRLRYKDRWNGAGEFDLFGHSWGAMLVAAYASSRPAGLRKLVLASGLARMQTWIEESTRLRKTMPDEVQAVLDRCEKEGTTESEEYEAAVGKFYARYLCRVDPMPADLVKAFGDMGKDPTVYFTMFGKNEFSCTGPSKTYDITPSLHKISAATLITNGAYDEATDLINRPFFELIPTVKWVQFARSAHMAHIEEEERYMEVVGGFLTM